RTTKLVQEARPEFHAHAVMARVMRWLFLVVGTLLAVVLGLSVLRHAPLLDILPLMLILLMSAVPVTLPVMFTVSMAVGSRELAKKGVLVTRLSAAEDAATMDTLCVDKTGTITVNRLAVTQVLPRAPATEADVLAAAALASQVADQDPLDLALLEAARARRVFAGRPAAVPLSFTPFDAARRRTEAVVGLGGGRLRVMKGAVETIAQACGLAPSDIAALAADASAAALKGHRTVAVAQGPEAGAPVLLGLVALFDPPRPDAAGLIASLRGLGVAVKLLTGDALAAAAETAAGLGLPKIRRMADVKAASDQGALAMLRESDGFAEVYPEDKFLFVKRLQAGGHVTGMTGDGVNDAPALRQAEVGIAVSSATDVAKAAASVVLTEAGLANIVALVMQGRTIYQRILTYIVNKISRTVLKTAFVAIAFVATGKFVLSAFAMLLLVFITDFAKISLATDRVRPSKRPETWNIGPLIAVSGALGAAMAGEALLLLWACWGRFGLAGAPDSLCSASFLILLYFAAFSILS
ncbi:MAG TPA: HAD-IC family P-type ATPase, partial [bacterium]|nr:HAD-IC family P-type ATPase [bacterium]